MLLLVQDELVRSILTSSEAIDAGGEMRDPARLKNYWVRTEVSPLARYVTLPREPSPDHAFSLPRRAGGGAYLVDGVLMRIGISARGPRMSGEVG